MAFTYFQGIKPVSQMLITAFIVLVCFFSLFLISLAVAIPFVGFQDMMNALSGIDQDNPLTIQLLKYFQVVQSVSLFIVPSLIVGWLFEGSVVRYFQLDNKPGLELVLIAICAVLVINPFISYVGFINTQMSLPGFLSSIEEWMRNMEDRAEMLIGRFMAVTTMWGLLFNIFMIAVIPAVGEELLFRGVIQKIFTNMTRNLHWGIWISAFLFSALHMQFYGFVPRMFLGALFGYMLVYSGSLWLPIICHFVNNLIGVLFLYAENRGLEQAEKISQFGETPGMWPAAAISLLATVYLVVMLRKRHYSKA